MGTLLHWMAYGWILLGVGTVAWAAPEVLLEADQMGWEQAGEVCTAQGKARLTHPPYVIEAETLRYNRAEQSAQAQGSVRFTSPRLRFAADVLHYSIATGQIQTGPFRMGNGRFYVEGEGLTGSPEYLVLERPRLYLHPPGPYALCLELRQAVYQPERGLEGRGARVRIGRLPVGYLPVLKSGPRTPRLRPHLKLGHRKDWGPYARVGMRFPLSDSISVEPWLGYAPRLDGLGGAHAQWTQSSSNWETKTRLSAATRRRSPASPSQDALGQPIPRQRYFIDSRGHTRLGERFYVNHHVKTLSDWAVEYELEPRLWAQSPFLGNWVEALCLLPNATLSFQAQNDPKGLQSGPGRRPGLRIDGLSQPVGPGPWGLWGRGFLAARQLRNSSPPSPQAWEESSQWEAAYQLTRPIVLHEGVHLQPILATRLQGQTQDPAQTQAHRFLGSAGVDLHSQHYALWEVEAPHNQLSGVGHFVQTGLEYRHGWTREKGGFQPLRGPLPQDGPGTLELLDQRQSEPSPDRDRLRLSLQNSLRGRTVPGAEMALAGHRNLAQLDFYQDLRPNPPRGTSTWSDLYWVGALNPASFLGCEVGQQLDSSAHLRLKRGWTKLRVHDADLWEFSLGSSIRREPGQPFLRQYQLEGGYQLTPRLRLGLLLCRDQRRGVWAQQRYRLTTQLHENWKLRWEIARLEKTAQVPARFQLSFQADLLRF